MSQCSYTFPTSPLTHPWHPNWWKVAASPLLGLLLPLLLHLPPLLKQQLLLPPFPSATPWLQPGGGRRPGSGWVGSPRNEDLWAARDGGQKGLGGGEGREGSRSSPRLPPLRKAALEEALPWSGSAEGAPLAPKSAGVGGCAPTGRGGEAAGPEGAGAKPLLASAPERSGGTPKFLPQEVGERGVLPRSRGWGAFLAGASGVRERGSFGSVPWGVRGRP